MAFSRTTYDACAYDLQIKRSTDQGDYRLNTYFAENNNQCYSFNGPIGSKSDVSTAKEPTDTTFGNMAEVESDLSWRNNRLDRCNDKKFNKFPVVDKPICSSNLSAQDTRFTNPIDNYRGMSLTSYMLTPYLYTNPQCYIQENKDLVGSNTRLETKDIYTESATKQNKNNNNTVPAAKNNNYTDSCAVYPEEIKPNN